MNEHAGYRYVPFSGDPFAVLEGVLLGDVAEYDLCSAYPLELVGTYTDNRCQTCGYRLDHPVNTHENCRKRR